MSSNRAPTADAVARSRDVIEVLTSVCGNNYQNEELMQILVSPHLQVRYKNMLTHTHPHHLNAV